MCSAASFGPAEPAAFTATLLAALGDVVENSLFGVSATVTREVFERAAVDVSADGWMLSSVRFSGSVRGCLRLTCPAMLMRELCAAYTGAAQSCELSEADLIDFAGEFANLTCGAWLTRACGDQTFRILEPAVARAPGSDAVIGEAVGAGSWRVFVEVNDTPIRLDVEWATAPPEPVEGANGG